MTWMHNWVWFTLSQLHLCHWPVVVFVYKRLQFHLGVTPKSRWRVSFSSLNPASVFFCHWPLSVIYTQSNAFMSLTSGQWHECTIECDLVNCIYVIDQWSMTKWMHLCHWPVVVFVYKRLQFYPGVTPKSTWRVSFFFLIPPSWRKSVFVSVSFSPHKTMRWHCGCWHGGGHDCHPYFHLFQSLTS